jgi:hypothetical protein
VHPSPSSCVSPLCTVDSSVTPSREYHITLPLPFV